MWSSPRREWRLANSTAVSRPIQQNRRVRATKETDLSTFTRYFIITRTWILSFFTFLVFNIEVAVAKRSSSRQDLGGLLSLGGWAILFRLFSISLTFFIRCSLFEVSLTEIRWILSRKHYLAGSNLAFVRGWMRHRCERQSNKVKRMTESSILRLPPPCLLPCRISLSAPTINNRFIVYWTLFKL